MAKRLPKRITLSMPDELWARISNHRDEFNLSGEFQRLMERLISKKERIMRQVVEDMEITVNRLRKEKQQFEGSLLDRGRAEGIKWANAASYDDLMCAVNWNLDSHTDAVEDTVKKWMDSHYGANNEMLLRGFLEGIEIFWSEIKDQL